MKPHIHFYCRKRLAAWPDIDTLHTEEDLAREQARFRLGIDVWIIQTYLRLAPMLRAQGHTVSIGSQVPRASLLLAHRDDLNSFRGGLHKAFIVAIRADRAPALAADAEILQNALQPASARTFFIPSWPQPGLVPREAGRADRIARMAYFGRQDSLPQWFSHQDFIAALQARGIDFEIRHTAWNDYHDIDLVLAHRTEAPSMLQQKPATKLTNAWLAGVPALLSPEPEYRRLRTCAEDFAEVSSPQDVLDAIDRLQADPGAYAAMRQQCARRAADFSAAAVAEQWLQALLGPLSEQHGQWLELGGDRRSGLAYAIRLWCQKRSTTAFKEQIAAELREMAAPPPVRTQEPERRA